MSARDDHALFRVVRRHLDDEHPGDRFTTEDIWGLINSEAYDLDE